MFFRPCNEANNISGEAIHINGDEIVNGQFYLLYSYRNNVTYSEDRTT